MTKRRPRNLEMLAEAFGGQEVIESIFSGESIDVGGVEFVCGYVAESSAERFYILKPMHLIERYRDLAEFAAGGNIVELGIAEGGSAALLSLWAAPTKLVTLDNEPSRVAALDEFAALHGLTDRLRAYFGVDQADRARLSEIIEAEFDSTPLDLVIDDASHAYWPTRASFETLFPLLRPGGLYVIEDWEADIAMADSVRIALADTSSPHHERVKQSIGESRRAGDGDRSPSRTKMARLALEIVILCGGQSGLVADVTVNRSFVAITRGDVDVESAEFRLDQYGVNGHGLLSPAIPS